MEQAGHGRCSLLEVRHHMRQCETKQRHGGSGGYPAHADFVKRKFGKECLYKAKRQFLLIQRVQNADHTGSADGERVDVGVLADPLVTQRKDDQRDGDGVDGVQNRHGDAQDRVQTLVAYGERETDDHKHPAAVGQMLGQGGEILRDGGNQADAGGQAASVKMAARSTAPGVPNSWLTMQRSVHAPLP